MSEILNAEKLKCSDTSLNEIVGGVPFYHQSATTIAKRIE
jgi:hypothetical protein